jgi:NADH-quinone oxidoreductase subunit L
VYKYGFDEFNDHVIMRGTRSLAEVFFEVGDVKILDDTLVNGSGRVVTWISNVVRRVQSGYLYHYALVMIVGLLLLLYWLLLG